MSGLSAGIGTYMFIHQDIYNVTSYLSVFGISFFSSTTAIINYISHNESTSNMK